MSKNNLKMYVARDSFGDLYLFSKKPYKGDKLWFNIDNYYDIELPKNMFPNITWKDKEATEVEVNIKIL